VHWSAEVQTKVYDPRKEGLTDRPTKRVNSRSLTKFLFRILQNSRKNEDVWFLTERDWSQESFHDNDTMGLVSFAMNISGGKFKELCFFYVYLLLDCRHISLKS